MSSTLDQNKAFIDPYNPLLGSTVGSTIPTAPTVSTSPTLKTLPTKPFTVSNSEYRSKPATGGYSQLNKAGEIQASFDSDGNLIKPESNLPKFGANLQTAQLGVDVLQGVGNYMAVREQNAIARDTFEFNKTALNRDYAQRLKDYNRKVRNSDTGAAANLGYGNVNDYIADRDAGGTGRSDVRNKPASPNPRKLQKLPTAKKGS